MSCSAYFDFEGYQILIHCNYNEKMENIIKRFSIKADKSPESIVFLYSGNVIDKNKTLDQTIKSLDRNNNKINIVAFASDLNNENSGNKEEKYTLKIEYQNQITEIPIEPSQKLSDIFEEFCSNKNIEKHSVYFCFNERVVYDELEVHDYLNYNGKERRSINLSVTKRKSDYLKRSNNLICPICGEITQMKIENFLISIFGCKYNHTIDSLEPAIFDDIQLINLSKIHCQKCKAKSKYGVPGNTFFYCQMCDMNLCPSCKSSHNGSHFIVDYDYKYNYCFKHKTQFSSYCKTCKENICFTCEDAHLNHEIISFQKLIMEGEGMKDDMEELNEAVSGLNDTLEEIKESLEKESDCFSGIYDYYNNNINKFNPKIKNYHYLKSFSTLKENYSSIIKDITSINDTTNFIKKLSKFCKFCDKMNANGWFNEDDESEKDDDNDSELKINELEKKVKEYELKNKEFEKDNKNLENEIKEYLSQITDYKNKIMQYEKTLNQKTEEIKNLNEKLKTTDTGMFEKYDTEKVLDLMEEINKKNNEIEQIKASFPIQIKPGEKLMTVIFISANQVIHYALICKNTDIFSTLEIKLYEKYPDYKESENYFLSHGKKINRYKSLDKNGIKNSDIITLVQIEE